MTAKLAGAVSRLAWYIGPPSVFVLMGLSLFPSGGQDDTHITCWPAYTLSQFGQILNYNGDRVEQSSSLLQVIILASLHKLTGLDLLTLAKLSSIAFGMASLLVLFTLVTRVTSRAAAFCAAIIAAASPPIVYWSFSGMESSLVSFAGICLVLAAADYMVGHSTGSLWKATLAVCAFALVRPETPLLLGCILASALAVAFIKEQFNDPQTGSRDAIRQRALLLLLVFVIVCGALFAFRLSYFGDLFPQPVAAKFSGLSVRNVVTGLHYLKRHAWNDTPATAIVTLTLVLSVFITAVRQLRRKKTEYARRAVASVCGGVSLFRDRFQRRLDGRRTIPRSFPAGGDWLCRVRVRGRQRQGHGPCRQSRRSLWLWRRRRRSCLPKTVPPASPCGRVRQAAATSGAQYSWFERRSRINVRDMPLIDNLDDMVSRISSRKQTPVVIISGQMGMVPYYIAMRHFGRVRFLDRHGLVDRALTDCVTTRDVAKDTGGLVLPSIDISKISGSWSGSVSSPGLMSCSTSDHFSTLVWRLTATGRSIRKLEIWRLSGRGSQE